MSDFEDCITVSVSMLYLERESVKACKNVFFHSSFSSHWHVQLTAKLFRRVCLFFQRRLACTVWKGCLRLPKPVLVLPHSNTNAGRVLSTVGLNKTKARSALAPGESLSSVMTAMGAPGLCHQGIKVCHEHFQHTKPFMSWNARVRSCTNLGTHSDQWRSPFSPMSQYLKSHLLWKVKTFQNHSFSWIRLRFLFKALQIDFTFCSSCQNEITARYVWVSRALEKTSGGASWCNHGQSQIWTFFNSLSHI